MKTQRKVQTFQISNSISKNLSEETKWPSPQRDAEQGGIAIQVSDTGSSPDGTVGDPVEALRGWASWRK